MRVALAIVVFAAGAAVAQPAKQPSGPEARGPSEAPPLDIEVPTLVLETGDDAARSSDSELDLTHIVESAAKAVTTVQEAPAIITSAAPRRIISAIGARFPRRRSMNPAGVAIVPDGSLTASPTRRSP